MKQWRNLDAAVLSLLAFFIVFAYAWHGGVGVSPDSIVYLSVARNLNAHAALVDYNQGPLVDFPAFYPLFLATVQFISRVDVLKIAPVLNGLLFSAVILLSNAILKRVEVSSRIYRLLLPLLLALSPALLDIYSMLWSETLFIVILLSFILTLSRYFKSRTLLNLFYCAVLAGLACVTRYAGVTLIGTGAMLLLFDPSLKIWKKVKHLSWFIGIAVLPLLLNLIHNAIVNDQLTGPRQMTLSPIWSNIVLYGQEIGRWVPGIGGNVILSTFFSVGLFVLLVSLFFIRSWYNRNYTTAAQVTTAFFIVYSVFIVGMSTISHFEAMNNRLLSPLYIPMMMTCTLWIPERVKGMTSVSRKYAVAFILLVTLVFAGFELLTLKELFKEVNRYGIPGYTEDGWKKSEVSRFLRRHPHFFKNDFTLYSNAHEAVYFHSNLRADDLPHHVDKEYIQAFFQEDGQYLIWFNTIADNELIDLDFILKNRKVVKTYRFKDGAIYFLLKK
jgi:hypothetical protein